MTDKEIIKELLNIILNVNPIESEDSCGYITYDCPFCGRYGCDVPAFRSSPNDEIDWMHEILHMKDCEWKRAWELLKESEKNNNE